MNEKDVGHGSRSERTRLLQEVDIIVNKDRNSTYGNPEDNFKDIADLWNAYLGRKLTSPITSMDVAVLNMLIKVARLRHSPGYRDGLVDIAGYAACGADIQAKMIAPKQNTSLQGLGGLAAAMNQNAATKESRE